MRGDGVCERVRGEGSTATHLENHKSLSSHFERLDGHNVQDWPELRENGVERLLQLCTRGHIQDGGKDYCSTHDTRPHLPSLLSRSNC